MAAGVEGRLSRPGDRRPRRSDKHGTSMTQRKHEKSPVELFGSDHSAQALQFLYRSAQDSRNIN